jgi:hypothetical protein
MYLKYHRKNAVVSKGSAGEDGSSQVRTRPEKVVHPRHSPAHVSIRSGIRPIEPLLFGIDAELDTLSSL